MATGDGGIEKRKKAKRVRIDGCKTEKKKQRLGKLRKERARRKGRELTAERVKGRALRVRERRAIRGSHGQEGDREKPR